jgi:hypothetical protein
MIGNGMTRHLTGGFCLGKGETLYLKKLDHFYLELAHGWQAI